MPEIIGFSHPDHEKVDEDDGLSILNLRYLFHLSLSFTPSRKPSEGRAWTYGFAVGRSFLFRTSNNYKIIGSVQSRKASNLNEDGKCKFGQKSYWDSMYQGTGDWPSEAYSWYCGYEELKPFWNMLAGSTTNVVLVAGIGNDVTPVRMFDDGWTNMIAFDYSQSAVERARDLFGQQRNVTLLTADARDLPLPSAHVDAVLDKGTLDAIYIGGVDMFRDSVAELTRVTAENGVVVCVSTVIPPDDLMAAFEESGLWKNMHNGGLAFADDGEATIDLGAELYSWRRLPTRD
eukprot:scaffold184_cov125-Cylindrotheca_fusiformis.AAC.4